MKSIEAIKQDIIDRIAGGWFCDPWQIVKGCFEYDLLISMADHGEVYQDDQTGLFYLP